MSDICRSPTGVALAPHLGSTRPNVSWTTPKQEIITIIVDGFFSSSPTTPSGIGGVFRDHLGTFLLHFVKQADAESAIHAKVLAIGEGMLIASTSQWASVSTFAFDSNSVNVVSDFWILLAQRGGFRILSERHCLPLAVTLLGLHLRCTRNKAC